MKNIRKHGLKQFGTIPYFFPIAELSTSITVGLIVWYGGLNVILEDSSVTLGTIFLFIQLISNAYFVH